MVFFIKSENVQPTSQNIRTESVKARFFGVFICIGFERVGYAKRSELLCRKFWTVIQWRRHTKGAANNEYSLFNHIWRYARKWGYTTLASPAQDVDKYPIKRRDHYVEDEIYQLVYRHASQDMQDLMDIAYLTGQRPVDVVGIQREHIFDGYLHIAQQKTQARLRFQMIGKLADILERRLKQEGNILFKTQNGSQLTVVNLRKQFFTLRNKIRGCPR